MLYWQYRKVRHSQSISGGLHCGYGFPCGEFIADALSPPFAAGFIALRGRGVDGFPYGWAVPNHRRALLQRRVLGASPKRRLVIPHFPGGLHRGWTIWLSAVGSSGVIPLFHGIN